MTSMEVSPSDRWSQFDFTFLAMRGAVMFDEGLAYVRLALPCGLLVTHEGLQELQCAKCGRQHEELARAARARTNFFFWAPQGTWQNSQVEDWYASFMAAMEGGEILKYVLDGFTFRDELLRLERGVSEYWGEFEDAVDITRVQLDLSDEEIWRDASATCIERFNEGDEFRD